MRLTIFFCFLVLIFPGCNVHKKGFINLGAYRQEGSGKTLELIDDGSYIVHNSGFFGHLAVDECGYASKGKWRMLSNDVLEINSEDNYLQQPGFNYLLNKGKGLSPDSLYIKVEFPTDFHPVKLELDFNYDDSKTIMTDSTFIRLSKAKYLRSTTSKYSTNRNLIEFSLNSVVYGTRLYNGRILFQIFSEEIDTEQFNYLTITLPGFDRCFYEFEPCKYEVIYVKNGSQLQWRGTKWKKSN